MVLFEPGPPEGTRYELETGDVSGGANAGSRHVGNMQTPGAAVAISVDGGPDGGDFELVLGYASGGSSNCSLLVNGVEQSNLLLPKTGGWSNYKAAKLTVTLKPGKNRMELRNQRKTGVNLDYIDLKRLK